MGCSSDSTAAATLDDLLAEAIAAAAAAKAALRGRANPGNCSEGGALAASRADRRPAARRVLSLFAPWGWAPPPVLRERRWERATDRAHAYDTHTKKDGSG